MRKKTWMFCMAVAVTAGLLAGCGNQSTAKTDSKTKTEETVAEQTETKEEKTEEAKEDTDEDFVQGSIVEEEASVGGVDDSQVVVKLDTSSNLSGKHHVEMDIQGMGTIALELDADSAPITVTNFVKLIQEDFYDGLTFHRIIDGFMMQGGDPLGNGTGGSKVNIKGEFTSNGVENNLSHTRGAVSMARAQAKDSASSQFFIVQTDSHYLDGEYAVFGYVTDGMDIVDDICKAAEPIDNNGTVEKDLQPVIEDVRILD